MRTGTVAIAAAAAAAVTAVAIVIAWARPEPFRPPVGAWAGRTAIVTGSNTGVGFETARRLALGGFRVVVACRSQGKAAQACARINAEIGGDAGTGEVGEAVPMVVDLASRTSIQAFAAEFDATRTGRLDVLVCNAGLAGSGSELLTTEDGFDLTFGTNYLGHFLLLRLLHPALAAPRAHVPLSDDKAFPARVVLLSSVTHRVRVTRRAPADFETAYADNTTVSLYSDSKLAMNVLAELLERRIAAGSLPPSVRYFAVNPGGVNSDVWRFLPGLVPPVLGLGLRVLFGLVLLDNEQGAETSVAAATDPALLARPAAGWPGGTMSPYLAPYWVPAWLAEFGLSGGWIATAFEAAAPFAGARVLPPHPATLDLGVAAQLWAVSERFVAEPA